MQGTLFEEAVQGAYGHFLDDARYGSEVAKLSDDLSSSARSSAMMAILDDCLDQQVPIVIHSSTGKDSTAIAALWCEHLECRKSAGAFLRRTIVAIADTGSEMPEMAARMQEEAGRIDAYGVSAGLPIESRLVRPDVKGRLLVEVLGNGKPLPNLFSGGSGQGWCMDRVKGQPLNSVIKSLSDEYRFFVQVLGTRTDESTRRAQKMGNYSAGLPEGLSRIGDAEAGSSNRIAFIPIAHWSDLDITEMFKTRLAPWDFFSFDELRGIYAKAHDLSSNRDEPTECRITMTQEGAVSTSCSDLSGTRMGCWMCMLSKNKSLRNMAKNDNRYAWLRKFHSFLYRQHDVAEARRSLIANIDMNKDTASVKTFTFAMRYFFAMMVLRAEMESGFTLLSPEECETIESLWRKHGVWTVTMADARRDAARWKETGKPRAWFAEIRPEFEALPTLLLPMGAFWLPSNGLVQPNNASGLCGFSTRIAGSGPFPFMASWEFLLDGASLGFIGDTPSVAGTKTNSGKVNNRVISDSVASQWELTDSFQDILSAGRNLFLLAQPNLAGLAAVEPAHMKLLGTMARLLRNLGSGEHRKLQVSEASIETAKQINAKLGIPVARTLNRVAGNDNVFHDTTTELKALMGDVRPLVAEYAEQVREMALAT